MYSFETIDRAYPAAIKSLTDTAAVTIEDDNQSLPDWISAARSDQNWHDNSLRAVGHLIAKGLADESIHALLDSSFTRPGYEVNQTQAEIQKMIEGARKKKWGAGAGYDPGDVGPIPLGFNRDGTFALRDQQRNIIVSASSNQLLTQQSLMALAASSFWAESFPSNKSLFNAYGAGEALIAACVAAGPFNPSKVRGRGVWLEGNREIINLGDPIPSDTSHQYLCFERISIPKCTEFETQRLLDLINQFNWRNPQEAMLWLGWIATAPICGVLKKRPHCFLHGPPKTGKTALHNLANQLLTPLVIPADGQSTEAGIRQTLGPDSLPIVIDEFESDHNQNRLRAVLRLARSAYSAETSLLRGTPEGKAMQFSLRTSLYLSAVNPIGMEPADETRWIKLELVMHDNDPFTARVIDEEVDYFSEKGGEWCGYMIAMAGKINPAVKIFKQAMPGIDMRHCENMAVLLAGAFVALRGREPTREEAAKMVAEFTPTVRMHGERLDRDDTQECLDHFFSHVIEQFPLWHWIATEYANAKRRKNDPLNPAHRILATLGIKVKTQGKQPGLYIRTGSTVIDKIFTNTKFEKRTWVEVLRKVPDAFTPEDSVYMPNVKGKKARCLALPLEVIPPPMDQLEPEHEF